jgi:hypothetical protein
VIIRPRFWGFFVAPFFMLARIFVSVAHFCFAAANLDIAGTTLRFISPPMNMNL